MLENLKPSDKVHVLDVIDPDAQVAGATSTAYVLATDYHQFAAIISAGVLGASATLDAKLEQAQDVGGTGNKDVGTAITQMLKATDDDSQTIINLSAEDFDVDNGFDWVRLTMTVGTATSQTSAVLLGIESRYGGAQAATVIEVVG